MRAEKKKSNYIPAMTRHVAAYSRGSRGRQEEHKVAHSWVFMSLCW